MVNVDVFKKFVFTIANDSGKGVSPSPNEFNSMLPRALHAWILSKYRKDNTTPQFTRGFQSNRKITDDLHYLISNKEFNIGTDGKLEYPHNFNLKTWTFYDNFFHTASKLGLVSLTQRHNLKVGDQIVITQNAGATFPQYDGNATVDIVLDDFRIVTNQTFLGNTPVNGGSIKKADNSIIAVEKTATYLDINSEFPPDYLHLLSLRAFYNVKKSDGTLSLREVDIKSKSEAEVGNILNSHITEPTNRYPISIDYGNYIQIYPKNIGKVRMVYLRLPDSPVWEYTTQNNRPVYDPVQSVDIDIPEDAQNELAAILLDMMGVQAREPFLVQAADKMQNEGI